MGSSPETPVIQPSITIQAIMGDDQTRIISELFHQPAKLFRKTMFDKFHIGPIDGVKY